MIEKKYDEFVDVALLAEGVDRNTKQYAIAEQALEVALLAEGVDRNHTYMPDMIDLMGRPPRGGRG